VVSVVEAAGLLPGAFIMAEPANALWLIPVTVLRLRILLDRGFLSAMVSVVCGGGCGVKGPHHENRLICFRHC
jgi:hypothetical protein